MTIREILRGTESATIRCLIKGTVVRRLTVKGNEVEVDAITTKVTVPLDTEVTYEPWVMDRGNLVFNAPGFGVAKFCTELDRLELADGRTFSITPEVK